MPTAETRNLSHAKNAADRVVYLGRYRRVRLRLLPKDRATLAIRLAGTNAGLNTTKFTWLALPPGTHTECQTLGETLARVVDGYCAMAGLTVNSNLDPNTGD